MYLPCWSSFLQKVEVHRKTNCQLDACVSLEFHWYTNLRMSPPEMIVIAEGQHFFLKLKTQIVRNSTRSMREMCNATSPHFVPCVTAVQLGKTRTVQTLKYVVVTANSRILIGSFEFDHQVNNISGKVIVGNSKLFLKQVQVCKDLTMLVFRRSKMLVYHRYRLPGCTARLRLAVPTGQPIS